MTKFTFCQPRLARARRSFSLPAAGSDNFLDRNRHVPNDRHTLGDSNGFDRYRPHSKPILGGVSVGAAERALGLLHDFDQVTAACHPRPRLVKIGNQHLETGRVQTFA